MRTKARGTCFWVVAAGALAVVGALGIALTVIVVDTPSDLWRTYWVQLLIVKTVAVLVAASLGAFNHLVLVPALEVDPEGVHTLKRVRASLRLELTALSVVLVLSALLVRAASVL